MARKKKTLPKNFDELIEAGDLSALQEVFTQCDWDARGGYSKSTALSFYNVPAELIRWLVQQGADVNARDNYQRTPLHSHAMSWCGHTELLLDLGADIEAADYRGETPLFAAAASFKPQAVDTLITRGANIHILNGMGQTPLEKALVSCRNTDIANMAEMAELLLHAGTPITPKMQEAVKQIGSQFEFHREGFNKEYLEQTDLGLSRLYELFDRTPVEKRKMHDGISLITVSARDWREQHDELWSWLIPSKGHAQTVQGEVIRITGKVSYEILDNGAGNWDNEFRKMLRSLIRYFGMGTPLHADLLEEAEILVQTLRNGDGDVEAARLCELAVQWVLNNPNPILMEQPEYER
ncbi:ankyrin repeat domain-containing protein [Paenibacillus wulumuqiensis]|uniref:ankyrin repeat domain-containing protein n=1 Tax=Paenibacillus wulumuqiensis TaxID=1567107 RepID=UPI0006197A8D|nr:ankyrin repeat domain-containing protein [Paenibacillus wulumuqiensis]